MTPPATGTRDEVQAWLARDPIARLEAYLRSQSLLDDADVDGGRREADRLAPTSGSG